MVAKGAFNLSEGGHKVLDTDFTFFKYIKYSIHDWANALLCCDVGWDDCRQIDATREEVNSVMDATRLFRRLHHFEVALLHLMKDENEKVCLSLTEPYSMEKVRENRLINDYYDAVIQDKAAKTLKDYLEQ